MGTIGIVGIESTVGTIGTVGTISGVASPNLMPGQRVGSLIYPQRLV